MPHRTELTVPIGGGYSIRLLEQPGRSYTPDQCADLTRTLRAVADRCVPSGGLRYGVLSGSPERLSTALIALGLDPEGNVVGFSAMTTLDMRVGRRRVKVVHAGLCLIDPSERRGGLCGLLTALPAVMAVVRNGLRSVWFTNVTQVPAVAGVFVDSARDVWPAPGRSSEPPALHRAIATTLLERHRDVFGVADEAIFDPERFVIANAYTGGSDELKKRLEECPDHRDPRYTAWCRDLLDYGRGDDVVQVGCLSSGHCLRLALRFGRGLARRVLRRRRRPALLPATGAVR